MITTAEHYKDKVAATIDADNNAIQEWVRVSKSRHALVNLTTSHEIVQQRKKQILMKKFSIPVVKNDNSWQAIKNELFSLASLRTVKK